MSDESGNFIECAVCGRNILRGERVSEYVTPERERVPVCALCKTRAEQMGWTPASLAGPLTSAEPQRRRGLDLRARFGGRLARRGGGKTADELAREIGIPDRPDPDPDPDAGFDDLDDPDPSREEDRPRGFDLDDDETRFPEPVTAAGQGRGARSSEPGAAFEVEASEPGPVDDEPASATAEHGMAEPDRFWDERAKPAAEQPAELRAEEEDQGDEQDEESARPPAREPRPPQSRRRSSRTSRRAASSEAAGGPAPGPSTPSAEPPRREPRTPARLMRTAAENFNASEESRKVGGLMRSLGEPSVSLRPPAREDLPALITVAWELSWYQWEVGVEPDDRSVREIAKGNELSELDDAARRWNARADEDGMIRLRRAESTEGGRPE
ncbi:hypothetical protein HJD18_06720 [Thermoleophilia bacterium SCSIO 60948]|nr:hypothetical protein HJD18_06720 [Thermoleophilia bacterium SCSIO 60948]